VGDKVWLNLRNYAFIRLKKKLNWLYIKFTVLAVKGFYVVEL